MKLLLAEIFILYYLAVLASTKKVITFQIDERSVCKIKTTCLSCLHLTQCTWCKSENKCFSNTLPGFQDYCKDNSTEHGYFQFSLEENARCSCAEDNLEEIVSNCRPAGVTDGDECYGRGDCVCGRCVCNDKPDPNNITKTIVGEYCEYDNFSCDGPNCDEGPYSIRQEDDNLEK